MTNDALIRDPVFQLNLLVWMAKEQPADGYRVRPLFFQHGFQLLSIEQPFPFPDATVRAIEIVELEISIRPEPELLLKRNSDQRALYFEAKANSFSPESSNSKQARGHLIACGPAFAEVLHPLEKALLCYVLPADKISPMNVCLKVLRDELQAKTLQPGDFSTHGLAVNGNDLVYSWDESFKNFTDVLDHSVSVIHQVEENTDPSPLLLVYSDEDCPDENRRSFYRQVLLQKLVATLVSDANLQPIEQPYTTTPRELALKTTDQAFLYLARRKQLSMERFIRQNIFGRISSFWAEKQFPPVKLEGNVLRINYKDKLAKEQFLDWLEDAKRTTFSDQMPPPEPPFLPGLEPGTTTAP